MSGVNIFLFCLLTLFNITTMGGKTDRYWYMHCSRRAWKHIKCSLDCLIGKKYSGTKELEKKKQRKGGGLNNVVNR